MTEPKKPTQSKTAEVAPPSGSSAAPRSRRWWSANIAVVAVVLLVMIAAIGLKLSRRASVESSEKKTVELPDVTIVFGKGFSNLERNNDGTWRWMADEGIVNVWNYRRPVLFRFHGRAPTGRMVKPPTIRVHVNGELLDEFQGQSPRSDHAYQLTAAQLGNNDWIEIKITTTDVVVPAEVDAKSKDHRRLGYQFYEFEWNGKSE